MKYMLMICGGGGREAPASTMDIEDWLAEMDGRGVRLLGRPLDPPASAATVRVLDGEPLVSDGPFAESKEFVAGFDIAECDDLDEAVEVAGRHPVAGTGAVEVRPFAEGFELSSAAREWAATEPADSWALFFCADGIPEAEATEAAIARESDAWGERLRERGTLVFGRPLAAAATATTVRIDGDRTLVSDGPFVETKEFIAGIAILHGIDREAAIALAAEHPLARWHRVEVRKFMDR